MKKRNLKSFHKHPILRNILIISFLIIIHFVILLFTKFIDWPEIILFPWFMKQGLRIYKDMYVVHSPGSVYLTFLYFNFTNFSLISYRVLAYILIFLNDILIFYISLWLWKKRKIAASVTALYIFIQVPLQGNSMWQEARFLPLMLLSYRAHDKLLLGSKH